MPDTAVVRAPRTQRRNGAHRGSRAGTGYTASPASLGSECRAGGEVVLDDLAAGRAPYALVAQDVGERCVERTDPVRHANDERMQANRHDAARLRALAVERVELATDHAFELVRRAAGAQYLGK